MSRPAERKNRIDSPPPQRGNRKYRLAPSERRAPPNRRIRRDWKIDRQNRLVKSRNYGSSDNHAWLGDHDSPIFLRPGKLKRLMQNSRNSVFSKVRSNVGSSQYLPTTIVASESGHHVSLQASIWSLSVFLTCEYFVITYCSPVHFPQECTWRRRQKIPQRAIQGQPISAFLHRREERPS